MRALWICGVLSALLYVAMNVVVPMRFEGYSSISQTVSELSAIGAPTRPLWVPLALADDALLLAFAWGVRAAGGTRALRSAGGLLLAYGAVGLVWPFAPMHLRGQGFSLTDTMHIAFAMVTVLLMVAAIGFAAAAFGARFRVYSFATIAVLLLFGILAGRDGPRVPADLPTPWAGLWQRISIAAFQLWVVVLAVGLLRTRGDRGAGFPAGLDHPGIAQVAGTRPRL